MLYPFLSLYSAMSNGCVDDDLYAGRITENTDEHKFNDDESNT